MSAATEQLPPLSGLRVLEIGPNRRDGFLRQIAGRNGPRCRHRGAERGAQAPHSNTDEIGMIRERGIICGTPAGSFLLS